MSGRKVPQPSLERMTPFAGHSILVGVTPGQDPLVVRTALALALATRAPQLHLAHVDTSRYVVEERADGTVRHAAVDPDADDGGWRAVEAGLTEQIAAVVAGEIPWRFTYLAGRPDRSLTHLARAVDAAAIVVGTKAHGGRMREVIEGSIAAHLAHHQHRPVLTVPLSVVDWKDLQHPWG